MPFTMTQFMSLVVAQDTATSQFGRFKESSLDPLIQLLGQPTAQVAQICEKLACIPYDKQRKYQQALNYLAQQRPLTEVRQIPYAIPSQPKMVFRTFKVCSRGYGATILNPGSYHHEFALEWKSSNGNMQSLAAVGTRERVTFRSSPASPPFNYVQANTPMTFTQGATTNSGASAGSNIDDHSTVLPSIICADPRVAGELVAEQQYEYTSDGATWRAVPGAAYLIKKGVRAGGGGFVFYLAKTNWAPNNTLNYRFEVEYNIDRRRRLCRCRPSRSRSWAFLRPKTSMPMAALLPTADAAQRADYEVIPSRMGLQFSPVRAKWRDSRSCPSHGRRSHRPLNYQESQCRKS